MESLDCDLSVHVQQKVNEMDVRWELLYHGHEQQVSDLLRARERSVSRWTLTLTTLSRT